MVAKPRHSETAACAGGRENPCLPPSARNGVYIKLISSFKLKKPHKLGWKQCAALPKQQFPEILGGLGVLAGMDVSVELWEEMGMAGVPQHPQTLTSNFLFFFLGELLLTYISLTQIKFGMDMSINPQTTVLMRNELLRPACAHFIHRDNHLACRWGY